MPLHPEAAAFLEQIASQKAHPIDSLPVDVIRRAALLGSSPPVDHPGLEKIENRAIVRPDGTALPLRIYVPPGAAPLGVCLYFHGGGWVLNNLDTHDELVRNLTIASGCVFVSVDYRLAPEHRYPAAIEDAYMSLCWVSDHAAEIGVDASRIAVAGDSAGGNLAAVVCLMSRDRGGPRIAFQALAYPVTDCNFERASYRKNAEGYFLTRREMIWFWSQYVLSSEQMSEPYASPLLASLENLPPAVVLIAEFDPLYDEGNDYAHALRNAGVEVTLLRYEGMIHAFARRVQQFEMARKAIQDIGQRIRAVIGGPANPS